MTPEYENLEYTKHKKQIATVNNIYNGIDTATTHLQQYNKEEDTTFTDRQSVATLNNFVYRVTNSIKNIVFRKDLDTSGLEGTAIEPYIDTIDYTQSLNSFSKDLLIAKERDGKAYILIDAPIYGEAIKTHADEIAAGLRPYLKAVKRSEVINWKYNDKQILERVTLVESYLEDNTESFEEKVSMQYRVLYYGGLVQVWRNNELYSELQSSFITIPLVEIGNEDVPSLYDLAKLNINHMNRGSELNNYIRIGAAPIPVTWGMTGTEGEVRVVGVNQGINFSGNKAEAGFEWVEMSGSNAEMIRKQMSADEEAMLDITVNLVTSNQPRTATEVNADNIENESRLVSSATALEEGINKALGFFADFLNVTLTEEQVAIVNKDFDSNKLTDEEVKDYRADYLAGVISWDKLINVLISGKRYPKMTEAEKEVEKANLVDPSGL